MPRATRRIGKSPLLAAPYSACEQPADIYQLPVRRNEPEQRFHPGDRVTIGGLQEFKVVSVEWSNAAGDYLVHGRFGVCKFYLWQKDVHHVSS